MKINFMNQENQDFENKEVKKTKKEYFLPISIVIAGVLIALAVIYSNGLDSVGNGNETTEEQEIAILENDHILGDSKAEITIFEFSDYECSYCAIFHSTTREEIVKEYIDTGKAKLVFRELPFHEKSILLSNAAWCAGDQDKYWEMHNFIFDKKNTGETATKEEIIAVSDNFGMDKIQFSECIDSETHNAEILEVAMAAQEAGIVATPISIITKKSSIKIDAEYLVSEMQNNKYIIPFDDAVVIIGAQEFSVFQEEIDKL